MLCCAEILLHSYTSLLSVMKVLLTTKYFLSAFFSFLFPEKQVLKQLRSKADSKFIATLKGTQFLFPIVSGICTCTL